MFVRYCQSAERPPPEMGPLGWGGDVQDLKDLGLDRSVEQFNRRDKQTANSLGYEATARGRALTDRCLPALVARIKTYSPRGRDRSRLCKVLAGVEIGRVAAAILSGAIHTIGLLGNRDRDATERAAMEQIGRMLERECRSARLLKKNARGYARIDWSDERLHQAGAWGIDMLMRTLPNMFERVLRGPTRQKSYWIFQLTEEAERIADEVLWECVRNNPHHMPMLAPPKLWRSEVREGAWGERQLLVECRPGSKRMVAVRKALARKSRPWLDALHKLESIPYRINESMLKFVRRSYEGATAGEPCGLDFIFHEHTIWRWCWDSKATKCRRVAIANVGDRNKGTDIMFRVDIATAEQLRNCVFYIPMHFDFRGRVNALPSFNFTRGDHIRALFEFAEGKPLGERGLYWLKVHAANCAAGFEGCKPGNLTFDERVRWVDDHFDVLAGVGRVVLEDVEADHTLLSGLDDRFQFARACIELYRADNNPAFVSHLPLLFDASASGFQHYCLMTKDEIGGREVNLVPGLPPQDVYRRITDLLTDPNLIVGWKTVHGSVKIPIHVTPEMDAFLDRRAVKKVMIPRIYSGRDIEPLTQLPWFKKRSRVRVTTTNGLELRSSTKGLDKRGRDEFAAGQLEQAKRVAKSARRCFDNIEAAARQLLPRPFEAMDFLYKLAGLLAKERKPLSWVTPTGFPWESRYHRPKTTRIKSSIGGKTVKTTITIGDLPGMITNKAKDAGAPNFVHGLDATHLQFVVLWARDAGMPLVTVHDCFGCLAADAAPFRAMVHDRLAQMYLDHPNVLGEVLEGARRVLSPAGRRSLPAFPEHGTLNIEEVRYAEYITG
jgi:DNA-directed RNA polymerase